MKTGIKYCLGIFLLLFLIKPASADLQLLSFDTTYCIIGDVDTIYAVDPTTQNWTIIPGITDLGGGVALLDPGAFGGAGTYWIQYHTGSWEVRIIDPPTATLAPFANVCENDAPFVLAGGSPAGGYYTVGVDDSVSVFNPAAYGPGTYPVTYAYGMGACFDVSPAQSITVLAAPTVSFLPLSDICYDEPAFVLTQGSPAGGNYTGPGVGGGVFDPVAAGIGTHTLTYTYSDGTCQESANQTITVNSVPVVSFTGLDIVYCDNDPQDILTGSPLGAGGVFTGNGITDNGDGTAIFDPAASGLGIHNITYSYTDINGCQSSETKQVRVGTLLTLTGIGSVYCEDITTVPFTYDPIGGNFTALAGLTDNLDGTGNFDPSTATAGIHTIEYTYTDIWGCVNVISQDVEVASVPNVTFIGLDPTYCANDSNIILSGNHAPQGTFAGPGITDNANGTARFDPVSLAAGGPYSISYSYTDEESGCGSSASNSTSILPIPTAVISGDATICLGASTNLTVDFTGAGLFDFTYTDGFTTVDVNGVGDPYSFPVSPTVDRTYSLVSVTQANGCSNTGSGSAAVIVDPQVQITTQPVSQSGCLGNNLLFTVEATGVGLSYQWQKDGVPLIGEINPNLPLNNIDASHAGTYTCIVSSTCGGPLTSNGAVLTLLLQTTITTQPVNQIGCEENNINFTMAASGSNLSYQWEKDGVPMVDGGRISGVNTNNLLITGIISTDAAAYTCTVSGDCGDETSIPVVLTVNQNILITGQPVSTSACPDDTISFGVTATGTALTYQWHKDGIPIPGETNSSLIIEPVTPADAGVYQCVVSGACPTQYSTPAVLTVNEAVAITSNPLAEKENCVGENVTYAISATGSGLSYQWRKDGTDLADGGSISGATSTTLIITGLVSGDEGIYTCIVSGSCGTTNSLPSQLIVDENPVITTQPVDKTVCEGGNTSFSIIASGPNLSYQWQKEGVDMPGETNTFLAINNADASDEASYHCIVTNACGDLTSSDVDLIVNDSTVIITQPASGSLCEGNNINFSLVASGTNLSYQWQKDGSNLSDGGSISGALSSNLAITGLVPGDAGTYNCIVTGSCGILSSDPATLVVDENINITSQPSNQEACLQDNVIFAISATGSSLVNQWQFNGTDLAGETAAILVLNSVTAVDEGDYNCIIINLCGSESTDIVSLTVNDSTQITTDPANVTACEGANTSFKVSATGANLLYQWKKNGVNLSDGGNISGTQTDQLVISGLLLSDAGIYTCEVTGSCGTIESAPASLVVNEDVAIITQPTATTACPGDNASFTIAATGTGLSYQWQKDGSDIGGAINPSISLNNVTAVDAGLYNCIVTGSCRITNSNAVNLTVNEDLVLTSQPADQDKCEGQTVTFSVAVTGTNPVYQWQKDGSNLSDVGNITGSGTKDLTISGIVLADGGNYTCVISGSCNSITSNAGILSVNEAISITTQPLDKDACEYDNIILNVAATGSNLSYQWQKDGVNMPGEINSSLVLDSIVLADAGKYHCIISNACGSVASNISNVVLHPSTNILSDPSDVTDCEGGSAGFSVDADGSNLAYQWKKNGVNLSNGGTVSGTDTKNLTITPLAIGDAGVYTCEVTGTCGTVSSGSANLTVNENIVILTQTNPEIVCPGNNVSFYVNASGTSLSYQWQKDGADIPLETNQTLVIDSVLAGDAGVYRCVISGACPSVITNAVSLTVNQDVAITTQPVSKQVCEGDNISFSVAATGTGISYQWKKNGINLSDGGNITGSQTSVLGINNTTLTDFGTYTCLVTGTCGLVNSNTATLTVIPNTQITVQPVDFIAINGGDASFSVSVDGSDLTFQWQKDGIDLSNGGVYSGVDTNILYLTGVSNTEEGAYTCVVAGICGSDNSDPGYLTVNDTAIITVQPSGNQVKCAGESANFNVVASGTNLAYQWQKNGVPLTDGGNVTGTTTAILQISNVQAADAGNYSCLVTADEGSETSLASSLTVNEFTEVTAHPADLNKCVGDDALLSVTTNGSNLIYQWRKDGVDLSDGGNITGSNSNILNITNLTQADAGNYYCFITGDCNDDNSTPARITVNQNTSITGQPSNKVKCEGGSATFSISADGDSLVYQWKKDGVNLTNGGNVTGATSKDLNITNLQLNNAGSYNCYVTGACGFETSVSASLTVNPETSITLQPVDQDLCENEEAIFIVEVDGANLGYQWRHDGANLSDGGGISGSLTSILTISNVDTSHSGVYQCYITGLCTDDISDPASLIVHPVLQILSGPSNETRCEGTSVTFSVSAYGDSLTYQWKKDGVDISDGPTVSGSNKKDLTITNLSTGDAGAYNCFVSGICGSGNTTAATLTVTPATQILVQPSHRSVNEGESLSFSVSTAPTGSLTFQWQKDGVALTDGGDISGSLTSVLNLANVDTSDAGSYTCVVTGPCGVLTSDPANLNVYLVTQILTHPSGQSPCEGSTVVLSITATGSNVSYEWKKDGVTLNDIPSVISGSATNNLTLLAVSPSDAGSYLCIVRGDGGNLNSNTAVLSVAPLTSILAEPSPTVSKCAGEDAYFVVNVNGDNLIYQWDKDGTNLSDAGNISGSGTSILTVSNLASADEGVYRVTVTGTCGIVTSEPSTLSVTDLPGTPGVIAGDNIICQGESGINYQVPEITNTTTYGWILPYDATIVSGNGSRFIEVNFGYNSVDGNVRVYGINACGSGPESADYPITVSPVPVVDAGWDQVACADTAVLAANPSAFGTWTVFNGTGVISNPNQNNSPVQNLSQGDNIFVWTIDQNGCIGSDTVIIKNRQLTVYAGSDQTLCASTATLNALDPPAGTGEWLIMSGGSNFNNPNQPNTGVFNLSPGTNVLRWLVNNEGCLSYDEVTLQNNSPSTADAGSDTIILTDTNVLNGVAPTIGTGEWSLVSGSGTIIDRFNRNTQVTGLGIGENIFRWTITNLQCTDYDEVSVINYTPTVTYAGPDQSLCLDQATLTGSKPAYGTGLWTVVVGSGSFQDATSYETNVSNLGKGENIFRWTIYEYEVSSDDVSIFNYSPTNANAGIDQNLCLDSVSLAGNQPLIGTGKWEVVGGSAVIENDTIFNSKATNLYYGSNSFRWTISNDVCISSDEVIINNNKPTEAYAGIDRVICEDSVTLYPNTPSIGSGEWSVIKGSGFFNGSKATNLAIDTNIFQWTISNLGCWDADTVVVVSNKPTTAVTGLDKSVCVDTIMLPGNQPSYGMGIWSILTGSAVFSDPNDPNAIARNLALGLNRFRWTISYKNCVSTSDLNVNFDRVLADAGPDQVICDDATFLEANSAGPGSGLWSVVGGSGSANFINPDQSNTEVTKLDKGENILRWTITNNGCISYSDIKVVNNSPSDAYAGPDRSICGPEVTLNANSPTIGTGEWSVLGGSATIIDPNLNTTKVTDLSLGPNTLRWTITNNNCISADEVVITNDQPTNIEAGEDQVICFDSTILYASIPINGTGRWTVVSGSAIFQDNELNNTEVYNLSRGDNILRWNVTSKGCSFYDEVVIRNSLPSEPNAGPDQDVCADSLIMAANIPFIGIGEWSIISGSAGFDNLNNPDALARYLGPGDNVLRWTIVNGDCYLSDDVIITNSSPTIAYAGEDRTICASTANLLATPPTTGTGYWTVVSGAGTLDDSSRFDTRIQNLGFGDNTVRWITEHGRCRSYDEIIITNNLAYVYAGPDENIYTPSHTLVGNKPAIGSGEWSLLAGQGTIADRANFETTVSNLGPGANTFTWSINNNNCIASDDVVLTHYVMPVANFIADPPDGCPPLTVSFVNNSIGGFPYSWDFGDGYTSNQPNIIHTFDAPGEYTVTLTATGPQGRTVSKDMVIVVHGLPMADFTLTPTVVYIPDQSLHCFNQSFNSRTYLWNFGDGTTSTEKDPSHTYTEEGEYTVSLNVWSEYQCFDSLVIIDAVKVIKSGEIIVPTGFTPNPDGPSGGRYTENDYSNDVFHPHVKGVAEYRLEVYNRLGILLFESTDVNIGWDGYFNGEMVDEGVYLWRVSGKYNNGKKFEHFGNVVLIRN